MTKLTDFESCVDVMSINGKHFVSCKLGNWGVSSPDLKFAMSEARHYFRQYLRGGYYHTILGGESPLDKLKKDKND